MKHVVQSGDCIASLAPRYGFCPDRLWAHPQNADLAKRRASRHVLAPGDVVAIPDRDVRPRMAAVGQRHVFARRSMGARLVVELRDGGRPLADRAFVVSVGGQQRSGRTDADGVVDVEVSVTVKEATIELDDGQRFVVRLGHLRPGAEPAGAEARLRNLGFLVGPATPDGVRRALARFQARVELEPTGTLDEATASRLREAHGS